MHVWVCVEVGDLSWVFFFLSHSPYCLRLGLSLELGFQSLGWCLATESRESFCPHLLVLGLQAFATMPGFICGCWGSCSYHVIPGKPRQGTAVLLALLHVRRNTLAQGHLFLSLISTLAFCFSSLLFTKNKQTINKPLKN